MGDVRKIVIINKSDSTGGAAVVSRRLMEAFRQQGIEASMLVTEKLTDSPHVVVAADKLRRSIPFLIERLRIFLANGFDRKTLFKIDTGSEGLPLWRHPLVKEADAILINWGNQGMLSLHCVQKLLELGKPVIWTMHDMWCMTGICHHAGLCDHFRGECGYCPLLGKQASEDDLSHRVWQHKSTLGKGSHKPIYVAVSNWLARKAAESGLLRDANVKVIPNAFSIDLPISQFYKPYDGEKITLLFGAVRLDDPIKGLPVLKEMTHILAKDYPELAAKLELVTFGGVKYPESLDGMGISHRHLGIILGAENIRKIYSDGHIVVSASEYETLPGTLVEAQAYGCIPVSFDQGGQADIIDHLHTGYLAHRNPSPHSSQENARRLADGIAWACGIIQDPHQHTALCIAMRTNVENKFSPASIVAQYLSLCKAAHTSSCDKE